MQDEITSINERIKNILNRIELAALRSNRSPDEITLVAVSKTKPVDYILAAYNAGLRDFGENYAQELAKKFEEMPKDIRWHMIGHLQSNKVKFVSGKAFMFHALDSAKLAEKLNNRLLRDNSQALSVLIMVNVGREPTKHGVEPTKEAVVALAKSVIKLEKLKLDGLMCLPPYFDNPEDVRPYFKLLRQLKEEAEQAIGMPLKHLSMGMSHDFEVAIEEGATILRIGTAIFGPRN